MPKGQRTDSDDQEFSPDFVASKITPSEQDNTQRSEVPYIQIEYQLEVTPQNKILVPGCEPTSALSSAALSSWLAESGCGNALVDLSLALEAIPGSYVKLGNNFGIGGARQKWFVLPGIDTDCQCNSYDDYYAILRELADDDTDETEDFDSCDTIGMGYCPSPNFDEIPPPPSDPYKEEGSFPADAGVLPPIPPWRDQVFISYQQLDAIGADFRNQVSPAEIINKYRLTQEYVDKIRSKFRPNNPRYWILEELNQIYTLIPILSTWDKVTPEPSTPILSSPIDAANGANASTGSVTTDTGEGVLYWVITQSATSPSALQIITGNDHNGSDANYSGSQAVSIAGVQNITSSGLNDGVTYYTHFAHRNVAENDSNVVTASGFTTDDVTAPNLSLPIDAADGGTASTGSVTTDIGEGTLYWVITQSVTSPSAAQIIAGDDHTGSVADDSGNQAVTTAGSQAIAGSGLSESTNYYTHFVHLDIASNDSNVVTASGFTTDDVTAPVLSSPGDAADGGTASTGSVTTDIGEGVLYWVITQSATSPSAAQIIAGDDHTGSVADDSGNQAVVLTGVQNIAGSSLSSETQYYTHFMHRDIAGNSSNVASASGFTTDDVTAPVLSSPTDTANGGTASVGSVSTDTNEGTLYWTITQSTTAPSVAQILAGQDHTGAVADDSGNQSVNAIGVQNIAGTGLTSETTYYTHYMHRDTAGNNSTVVSASGFTTTDVTSPVLSSATDAANGGTASTGSVSTNEGNGTLYWVITQSATSPDILQIINGQDHTGAAADDFGSQVVNSTGVQNISGSGLSSETTYYTHFAQEDLSNNDSVVVTASGFTTADVTAPILSSPTDESDGDNASAGTVTTDTGEGTLYWVTTLSATTPSAIQVLNGQDHTGAAATDAFNSPVVSAGLQNTVGSNLSEATTYYTHFMHQDASGNNSNVVSASGFTTDDITPPTLSSPTDATDGGTASTGFVTTDTSEGVLYWVITQSATSPSAAQIIAGDDHTGSVADDSGNQAVVLTGVQNIAGSGLTSETQYYTHFMHRDIAGNSSNVVSASGFTTGDIPVRIESPSPLEYATLQGQAIDWTPTLLSGNGTGTYTISALPAGASMDPSTGRITGTLNTLAATPAMLTYTEGSLPKQTEKVPLMFHVYDQVDTTTLAGGSYAAPAELTNSHRLYRVQGDITFDGMGIAPVSTLENILVDLNGFTIAYDAAAPTYPAVTNNDFSSGATGWDTTLAPDITGYESDTLLSGRVPDPSYNALHATSDDAAVNTVETIQTFDLVAGERLAVTFWWTNTGEGEFFDVDVTMGTNVSTTLAYADNYANIGWRPGAWAVWEFEALATETVPLSITWTNKSGATQEFNLTDVKVTRSAVPGGINFSFSDPDIKPGKPVGAALRSTACNGVVTQVGTSVETPGVEVDLNSFIDDIAITVQNEVMVSNRGSCVVALNRGTVITNCVMSTPTEKIASRDKGHGWVVTQFSSTAYSGIGAHFRDNTILESPQGGISLTGQNGHDFGPIIKWNTVNLQQRYTNGFGFIASSVDGIPGECSFNVVDLTQGVEDSGRGIRVNAYMNVHNNTVKVRALPTNVEYVEHGGYALGGAYAMQLESNVYETSYTNETYELYGDGGGGCFRFNGTLFEPVAVTGCDFVVDVSGPPQFDASCLKLSLGSGGPCDLDGLIFDNCSMTSNYHLFEFSEGMTGTALALNCHFHLVNGPNYTDGEPWETLTSGRLIIDNPTYEDAFTQAQMEAKAATDPNVFLGYPQPTAVSPSNVELPDALDTTGGITVDTMATVHENSAETTFVYTLNGGADVANFSIVNDDELVFDDGVLDIDIKASYEVIVRVTDSYGQTHDETITITVSDFIPVVPTMGTPTAVTVIGLSTVTVPTPEVGVGDTMLMFVGCSGSRRLWEVPPGWYCVMDTSDVSYGNSAVEIYKRKATASEPASWDLVFSGGGGHSASIVPVSGTDYEAIENFSRGEVASGGSIVIGSLSLANTNTLLLGSVVSGVETTITPPAGDTPIVDEMSGGSIVITTDVANQGATGSKIWTYDPGWHSTLKGAMLDVPPQLQTITPYTAPEVVDVVEFDAPVANSPHTVPAPSNMDDDTIIILAQTNRAANVPLTPAGFTTIGTHTASGVVVHAYKKLASNEPATYVVENTDAFGSGGMTVTAISLRNADYANISLEGTSTGSTDEQAVYAEQLVAADNTLAMFVGSSSTTVLYPQGQGWTCQSLNKGASGSLTLNTKVFDAGEDVSNERFFLTPTWPGSIMSMILHAPYKAPLSIDEIKPQMFSDGAAVSVLPSGIGGVGDGIGTTPYVWSAVLADGTALSTVNLQINSSTGEITNNGIVPDGHYQVILILTDADSTVATYDFLIVVYNSLLSVATADMPTQPAPYEMSTADRVYQLSEDITVDGAGFAQLANNVALDLNGHTLTYNDAAVDTILNQDFSDWNNLTSGDPDNWTVNGDSAVTEVAKASSYIQPKRMCEGTSVARVTNVASPSIAGTLTAGTPANIESVGHGLTTGDAVIVDEFSATSYGSAHATMIQGGYIVTVVDVDNFTINADVSAVSDGAGTWKKATVLESDAIAIPSTNRLYAFTAFCSNLVGSEGHYNISAKVVNAGTGLELQKMSTSVDQFGFYSHTYINNTYRNGSPACVVLSGGVTSIKTQIFVASSSTTAVDICRARLSKAYDHAVQTRGNNDSQWPPQYNIDTSGWATTTYNSLAVIDSVGGGAIVQGQNKGFRGWPLLIRKTGGVSIYNAEITQNGDDPCQMFDQATLGNPGTIRPCIVANSAFVSDENANVTRRDSQMGGLTIRKHLGDVRLINNTMFKFPSASVGASTDDPTTYSVYIGDNTIKPNTVCTNAYAISANGSNTTVENNIVNSLEPGYGGRGIFINGGQNNTVDNVTITGNTVQIREFLHREAVVASPTRALRIRNQENGDSTNGTLLNLTVTNNLFEAHCDGPDQLSNLHAARISHRWNNNGEAASSYTFANNTYKAVNHEGSGSAIAIEIGRWDTEIADVTFDGETMISNDIAVKLHGNDDTTIGEVEGVTFTSPVIIKDPTPGFTFTSYSFGYNASSITNNTEFNGASYQDGADNSFVSVGTHDITFDGNLGILPTIVDHTTCAVDGTETVRAMNVPTNTDGDLLLWWVSDNAAANGQTDLVVPAGWQILEFIEWENINSWLLAKVASSEPASYNIDFTGAAAEAGSRSSVMASIQDAAPIVDLVSVARLFSTNSEEVAIATDHLVFYAYTQSPSPTPLTEPAATTLLAADDASSQVTTAVAYQTTNDGGGQNWTAAANDSTAHITVAVPPA